MLALQIISVEFKLEDEEFEKLLGEITHVTNGSMEQSMPAAAIRDQVSSMPTANHNPPLLGWEVFGQFLPAFQGVDDLQQNEDQSFLGAMPRLIGSQELPKLLLNGEQQPHLNQEEDEAHLLPSDLQKATHIKYWLLLSQRQL